jgi:hypothetical protein
MNKIASDRIHQGPFSIDTGFGIQAHAEDEACVDTDGGHRPAELVEELTLVDGRVFLEERSEEQVFLWKFVVKCSMQGSRPDGVCDSCTYNTNKTLAQ